MNHVPENVQTIVLFYVSDFIVLEMSGTQSSW
jgi:hypothetical protein